MTNKTVPNSEDVMLFLQSVPDDKRREDSKTLCQIMSEITGLPPVMWGKSIVGFGNHHYKYATGREGDTPAVGFAPRKEALVLYSIIYYDQNSELSKKLGKFKTGKGCLYIKHLEDVDLDVLRRMIARAFQEKINA